MSTATAQAPAGQAKVTKPRKASEQAPEHLTSAEDLQAKGTPPKIHDFSKDREVLSWKVNTAPQTSETLGKELLTYYGDTFITDPPLNKVNIRIGVGIDIKVSKATKGVKVKDVIDAIYTKYGKKFKKDEDLELPYLVGFTWDADDGWGTLTAVMQSQPLANAMGSGSGKKSKKAKKAEAES